MHIVNKRDFLASIVLLLGMLGFYVESTRIDTQGGVDLGPLFFPHLMVIVIAILSVALLFKSISFSPASEEKKAAPEKIFCTTKDQTVFIALFFIYLIALPSAGYIPATLIYLIVNMIYLGQRGSTKWYIIYICSTIGMTAFIYYIFAKVMLLFLP